MAWIEQGSVLAVANIRRGGEYGRAWHAAGQLEHKQNVFDDFIAAGQFLKAAGITPEDGLAIQGESNGGLLIGAVVNQRPDLFAAALPGVGVMDMLRYHQFTGGPVWMADFGNPAKERHFDNLLSYSPYHNISPGKDYPAILATAAGTGDRVVPGHSLITPRSGPPTLAPRRASSASKPGPDMAPACRSIRSSPYTRIGGPLPRIGPVSILAHETNLVSYSPHPGQVLPNTMR